MVLRIDRAILIAVVFEALFFGLYLVTLFPCLKALLWRDNSGFFPFHSIRWTMLIVCLIFGVLASMDLSVEVYHVIYVFTISPDGAIAELLKISDWINVWKTADGIIPALIADLVLIYRCWIVYSKSTIIIVFPILLWLGCTVSGLAALGIESMLDDAIPISEAIQITPFLISFFTLNLVQNIFTTSLIIYRIWSIDRAISSREGFGLEARSPLWRVTRIVIESGMLYTINVIVNFISFLTGSAFLYISADLIPQTIGIAFNLIIIRTTSLERPLPYSSTTAFRLTTLQPSSIAVTEGPSLEELTWHP